MGVRGKCPESTKRGKEGRGRRCEMLLLKMIPISMKVKRVYTPTALAFLQIRLVTEKEEEGASLFPSKCWCIIQQKSTRRWVRE